MFGKLAAEQIVFVCHQMETRKTPYKQTTSVRFVRRKAEEVELQVESESFEEPCCLSLADPPACKHGKVHKRLSFEAVRCLSLVCKKTLETR